MGSERPRLARDWLQRWSWRYALVALIAAALGLAGWVLRGGHALLERIDQLSLEAQIQWRGPLAPGGEILLLRVDDASAAALQGTVPERRRLAEAVRRLAAAGAKLVALDLLLLAPSQHDAAADAELASALRAAGNVLLPFALPEEGMPQDPEPRPDLLANALMRHSDEAARERLLAHGYRPARLLAPLPALGAAALAQGHVSARRGSDGSLRWDFPALPLADEVYPSLALRLAAAARGLDWRRVALRFGSGVQLGEGPGSLWLPLDTLSRQWVNYYGPAGSFEGVSLIDLLEGRVAPERIRGKVVLLGVTALGAGDVFPSPFDAGLPGVERLATVADNILTGRALARPPWAAPLELALLLGLPLLACALLARWPLRRALPGLGLALLALLAAAQALFVLRHEFLALSWPLLALALAAMGALMLRAAAERARRRAALQALRESEQRYALAAQGANDGLWDWDIARDAVVYSERWLALMGLAPEQAGGRMAAWTAALDEAGRRAFDDELQAHLAGRSLQFHHVLHFEQGGQARWLLARGVATRDAQGKPQRMAGSLTDISEQRRLQQQLSFDALHDRLTGLPNRRLLLERLAAACARGPAGLLILGLDGFRAFNERHGSLAGDAVLIELAQRLRARGGADLARLGPDEFGIAFAGPLAADGSQAERLPEWALARLVEGMRIEIEGRAQVLHLSACVGWAHSAQGPEGAEELLAAAEDALARAKRQGAGQLHVFDAAEQLVEQSRQRLREDIDAALREGGQFQLHYQPFVRLADRALLGFEALIRWKHPKRGVVMPGDFIPVAEASGQIAEIGRWTLIEAAEQLRRWRPLGFDGEIAVNVSGVQLERDLELLADARAVLRILGDAVPPRQLKLEVTESMAMANPQRSAELLRELSRLGFKLSIDDFGTGYSSLAYLHRFPFDTLKVDRSFVIRLAAGREAQEIVRTIVGLARALEDKQTLAEGVEDEAQARLLEELGVQVAQGWLFAKALPEAQAQVLVEGTLPWAKR